MKIERETVARQMIGDFVVDTVTVTYRKSADGPVIASELSFKLAGETVAASYTFSPEGEQWRDAFGAEVTLDYMSARGLGRLQRHVVEAVGRTWALLEETLEPESVEKIRFLLANDAAAKLAEPLPDSTASELSATEAVA